MKENFKLYLGNSYELIKQIPTASVDLILTDPPYNLSPYSTGNIEFNWRKDFNNDLADWDKVEFKPSDWVSEFKRILKPTGNIFAFCSYNLIGKWHEAFDPEFDTFQFMVWHKTNPPPKVFKAGFLNSCELIVCTWNKGHTWNFGHQKDMHNFIESPICMGKERIKDPHHPTQKPLELSRKLILSAMPKKDGVVLVPFVGSGSECVAAKSLGQNFIGFELNPDYIRIAEARLNHL